ncbi:hypothetical protein PGB90_001420 [Kerria lacca]
MLSRKKRRGIIEKRRRDRINTSLSELRRLVPTAYEKQGSAKLEKAEILQMTVDHLKMLHAKGYDSMAYDPSKFAMNYHSMGFHECINEVNRHLTAEGLDPNDPLRTRLVSYLQSVTVQREFASKQSAWYPSGPQPPPPPPPPNASQPYHSNSSLSPIGGSHHLPRPPPPIPIPPPGSLTLHHNASLNSSGSSLEMNSSNSLNNSNPLNSSSSLSNSHSLNSSFENSGNSGNCEPTPISSSQSSASSTNTTIRPLTTLSSITDGYNYLHHNPHQHVSMDLYQHHSQHLHPQHPYGQPPPDASVSPQMKQPYRPWGAEVAY